MIKQIYEDLMKLCEISDVFEYKDQRSIGGRII